MNLKSNLTSPPADAQVAPAQPVRIPVDDLMLPGDCVRPAGANRMVVFVHGTGSNRFGPQNQVVAQQLQSAGIGTLRFDLLTPTEEQKDRTSGYWSFDVELLAHRLVQVSRWLQRQWPGDGLAYFGSSTGAAAALVAAAELGREIQAVVSHAGRPDFAGKALGRVSAPTLFIVGELAPAVLELNQGAFDHLTCEKQLSVVAGASHLFVEPGTLDRAASLATTWFHDHLKATDGRLSVPIRPKAEPTSGAAGKAEGNETTFSKSR
jgi:dienelactone hydrolase